MNSEHGIWIIVAIVAITSLGILGTTLDTTIHTDPADVYDSGIDWLPSETVTYEQVPIDRSDLAGVREEIEAARTSEPTETRSDGAAADREQASTGTAQERAENGGHTETTAHEDDASSWWDRLIERLLTVLQLLVLVIAGIGAAYALNRYRGTNIGEIEAATNSNSSGSSDEFDGHPDTVIDEAWVAVIRHAGIDDINTKTTRDCARIAIGRGLDPALITDLTAAFEQSRYGEATPSQAEQRTAIRVLTLLGDEDQP